MFSFFFIHFMCLLFLIEKNMSEEEAEEVAVEAPKPIVVAIPPKKRLQGLAMDLDMGAYTWFRRRVMECSLVYLNIHPMGHPCWTNSQEVMIVPCCFDAQTGRATRHFYGCLRCGRTHVCLYDSEYLTCPRVSSPNNPDSFVCGFSGVELTVISGTDNSSFRRRDAILGAMKDMLSAKELKDVNRTGIRSGLKMAQGLEQRANLSESRATRNTMYKQAREARQRSRQHRRTMQYERDVLQANKRRYLPKIEKVDEMVVNKQPAPRVAMSTTTPPAAPGAEELQWLEQMIAQHKEKSAVEREREDTMEFFRRRIIEASGAYRYEMDNKKNKVRPAGAVVVETPLDDNDETEKKGEEDAVEDLDQFMDPDDPAVMVDNDDDASDMQMDDYDDDSGEDGDRPKKRSKTLAAEDDAGKDTFFFKSAWGDGDYGLGALGHGSHGGDDDDDGQWEEKLHDDEERRHARLTARGILDPTWYAPPIVIPTLEMEQDDALLQAWLDPVADYMAEHCDFSIFGPLSKPLPASILSAPTPMDEDATTTLTGSADSGSTTPSPPRTTAATPFIPKKKRRPSRRPQSRRIRQQTLWFVLHPTMGARDQLPHQRSIQDYVGRFMDYYRPLTPASIAQPPEEQRWRYVLFCDRLLWVYHYDTGHFRDALWPDKPKGGLERILFAILTLILTRPGYGRDAVSHAKIPVWIGCPWLTAMAKAGKFHPAPAFLLSRTTVNLEKVRAPLMSILHCTNFSPHTLSHFLLPPLDNNDDDEEAAVPVYVQQRRTELL